jgi:F0F1-type ATP synthase assembly protein I
MTVFDIKGLSAKMGANRTQRTQSYKMTRLTEIVAALLAGVIVGELFGNFVNRIAFSYAVGNFYAD